MSCNVDVLGGVRWWQVVAGGGRWCQMVSGGVRWCQVIGFSPKGLCYNFEILHGLLTNKIIRIPMKKNFGDPPSPLKKRF